MKSIVKVFGFAALAFAATSCSAPEGKEATAGEAKEVTTTTQAEDVKTFEINTSASKMNWVGTKPAGEHSGFLNLSEGNLMVSEGKIQSGTFVLDMVSITCTDLQGEDKTNLEGHLKNNDFFEVEKFPTGEFAITEVKELAGEGTTHQITGNLTLKGITKSVTFAANVEVTDSGVKATAPQFLIDRTEWEILYKSSKVGDMAINDKMGVSLQVEAKL